MIDAKKLDSLSIDVLFKLKAQIDDACKRRRHLALVPGREATFMHNGETIRIMITGRGSKNIMGYRIDALGTHLHKSKWRCHPDFLMPYFPPPKPVAKPIGIGADVPATAAAW